MGLLDWLQNASKSVYGFTKDAVQKIAGETKAGITSVWDTATTAANEAYSAGKGIVNFAGEQIDKVTSAASNVVTSVGGGLGSMLSSPLFLIALIVGGVVVMKEGL